MSKRRYILLSKKIRDFNPPQFTEPSKFFDGYKFTPTAESEYCEIPENLRERVNLLIKENCENRLSAGRGEPEFRTTLNGQPMRYWRRKINDGNRLRFRKHRFKFIVYV